VAVRIEAPRGAGGSAAVLPLITRRTLAAVCRGSAAVLPRPLGAILPRFCRDSVGVLPVPRGHFAFFFASSPKNPSKKTSAAAPRALRRRCGPRATRHRLRTPHHPHHRPHLHPRRCVPLLGAGVIAPGPHTPTPRATRAVKKKEKRTKKPSRRSAFSLPAPKKTGRVAARSNAASPLSPAHEAEKTIKRQKRCRYVAAVLFFFLGSPAGNVEALTSAVRTRAAVLGNRARFNCRAPTHSRVLLLDGAEVASLFHPTGIASGLCTTHHPLQPTVKMAAAVASAPAQQPQQPQQPAAPAAQPAAAAANAAPAQAPAQGAAVPHASASLYAGACHSRLLHVRPADAAPC